MRVALGSWSNLKAQDDDEYEGTGIIGDASDFKGERNPLAGDNPGNRRFKKWKISPMNQLIRKIEQAFEKIPEPVYMTVSEDLNFSAPSVVPGFTDQVINVSEVELGDTVAIGCSITAPTGFMPPIGFVSADGEITIRWLQVTGAAADPDGSGATYTIDIWRH